MGLNRVKTNLSHQLLGPVHLHSLLFVELNLTLSLVICLVRNGKHLIIGGVAAIGDKTL